MGVQRKATANLERKHRNVANGKERRGKRRFLPLIVPLVSTFLSACTPPSPNAPAAPAPSAKDGESTPRSESPALQAQRLVEQMTLDEKIAYIGGDRDFFIRAVPRLKIPAIKMSDGPAGCRNWGPSTAYPASIGIAASFDRDLAHRVGTSIGRDCRARGVHILLAPGVNLQRSPLAGRNFEYLGEDPLLARDLSTSTILAVQSQGVLATVKHFALNNQEWDRHHVSSEVSERALRELYLPAFEGAVRDAQVGAVMTSYNLINGSYGSHNEYLLRTILREEWGFEGIVMSDWSAVHDTKGAFVGGTDLEMPRATFMSKENLLPLFESGELDERLLDEKVLHILTTLIKAGFLDRSQSIERPVDDPKSRAASLEAARRSIVLLKNSSVDDEPVLPISQDAKTIAVIGPNAHPAVHGGSGSAYVTPTEAVSLVQALKKLLPDAKVTTHPGIRETSGFGGLGAPLFAGPLKREIFLGTELRGEPVSVTRVDRIDFRPQGASPAPGVPEENYSIRWSGQLSVPKKRRFQFLANADDGVRIFIDDREVLSDWSDHAPRLTQADTVLDAGTHEVVVEYFQGILGAICQVGFANANAGKLHGHEELEATLEGADVVILALGYGQSEKENSLGTAYQPFWPPPWARQAGIVEAEDDDRPFSLPLGQQETIRLVTETSKRAVAVGFAGGGIDFLPWLDDVEGLLWAWYPGTEGGTALSEILLGRQNPSGHLPVTFAKKYSDHPSSSSYSLRLPLEEEKFSKEPRLSACSNLHPVESAPSHPKSDGPLYQSPYCEGLLMGYRGFDASLTEPLFPFGFGLSYTDFTFDQLEVRRTPKGKFVARVRVTNSGPRAGRDVVQFYVAPLDQVEPEPGGRPPQQLAGFSSVELAAGASRLVSVDLSDRAFSVFRPGVGWVLPKGRYEVRASHHSRAHERRAVLSLDERVTRLSTATRP